MERMISSRVLYQEDHQKCHYSGRRVHHELPSVGVVEVGPEAAQTMMTNIAPRNDHFDPAQQETVVAKV